MTSTHQDDCEPNVKKERFDEEELDEMFNCEVPVQVDFPDTADNEIDPLMPRSPMQVPVKSEQVISTLDETELDGIRTAPKLNAVITHFKVPSGQLQSRTSTAADLDSVRHVVKEEVDSSSTPDDSGMAHSGCKGGVEINTEEDSDTVPNDELVLCTENESQTSESFIVSGEKVLKAGPKTSKPVNQVSCQEASRPNGPLKTLQSLIPKPQVCSAAVPSTQPATKTLPSTSIPSAEAAATEQTALLAVALLPLAAQAGGLPVFPPLLTAPLAPGDQGKNDNSVSVSQILENPFMSDYWTTEQKFAIISCSRPMPNIHSPTGVSATLFYIKTPWLCGCATLKQFFCWPCLLFLYHSPHSVVWFIPTSAVATSDVFDKTLQAHEVSDQHQKAQKNFTAWLDKMKASQPSIPLFKKRYKNLKVIEKVSKNRRLLSLLVQTVCLVKKDSHYATMESYREYFADLVGTSKELQSTLRDLEGDTSQASIANFVCRHAQLVEDSVKKFIGSKIADELKNARLVTLFFEDFSSIVDTSTFAMIAHFINPNGKIQQHVMELIELDKDRSVRKIFPLIQTLVFKHALSSKLAGYTYSATLINPSETETFNKKFELVCLDSKLFHYQKHNLFGMLFGALSHLESCSNFCHTMATLADLFRRHLLSSFLHYELLNPNALRFEHDFEYSFMITIRRGFSSVLQALRRVLQHHDDWDDEVCSQAPILLAFLQDINTRFLIALISQLNLAVWDLAKALQGKIVLDDWKLLVRRSLSNVLHIQKYGFKDIYAIAVSPILVKSVTMAGKNKIRNEEPSHLVNTFHEVVLSALTFLRLRFSSPDFGLVNPDLGDVAQTRLKDGHYFTRLPYCPEDVENLHSEHHHVKQNTMLSGKLVGTLKCFYEFNLAKALPAYAAFLDFVMTIPSSWTSDHCTIVESIQAHRISLSQTPIPKDPIWMEKELLAAIAKTNKLSEAVIDIFSSHEGTNEFSYGKEALAYLRGLK